LHVGLPGQDEQVLAILSETRSAACEEQHSDGSGKNLHGFTLFKSWERLGNQRGLVNSEGDSLTASDEIFSLGTKIAFHGDYVKDFANKPRTTASLN